MSKAITFFTLILLGITASGLQGQTSQPQNPEDFSVVSRDSIAFGEALVALAWKNYPENDAYRMEVKQQDYIIRQAKYDWLDGLTASFNLNEGNINPSEANPNLFFPRYNFGFRVSVGSILSNPSKVKYAALGKDIASKNVEQQKLAMRREVLSRYYNYLFSLDLLKVQMQAYQDIFSNFTMASQSFRNGEISLDEYNKSLAARNVAQQNRLNAQRELVMAELQLEELIGMELEKAKEIIRPEGN